MPGVKISRYQPAAKKTTDIFTRLKEKKKKQPACHQHSRDKNRREREMEREDETVEPASEATVDGERTEPATGIFFYIGAETTLFPDYRQSVFFCAYF